MDVCLRTTGEPGITKRKNPPFLLKNHNQLKRLWVVRKLTYPEREG